MYCASIGGRRCPTKKALREALAANPASVLLVDTSAHHPKNYRGDELPEGLMLPIVGPDPYKRIWYANVRKMPNGTVRVK